MIGGCGRNMSGGPDGDSFLFRFSASTVRRYCTFPVRVESKRQRRLDPT